MNKEEIKELARQSMLETLKNNLDSAMIFTYVKSLEDRIDKAIEYTKHLRDEYFRRCIFGSSEDLSEIIDILEDKND